MGKLSLDIKIQKDETGNNPPYVLIEPLVDGKLSETIIKIKNLLTEPITSNDISYGKDVEYVEGTIGKAMQGKAETEHTHNADSVNYDSSATYGEGTVGNAISNKADTNHTHNSNDISFNQSTRYNSGTIGEAVKGKASALHTHFGSWDNLLDPNGNTLDGLSGGRSSVTDETDKATKFYYRIDGERHLVPQFTVGEKAVYIRGVIECPQRVSTGSMVIAKFPYLQNIYTILSENNRLQYFLAPTSGGGMARCYVNNAGEIKTDYVFSISGGSITDTTSAKWIDISTTIYIN